MTKVKKKRRPTHPTQWAAQFAVASELCKRDYQVALTLGNHPAADLMATSPRGISFSVDVKGLRSKNPWLVKRKPDATNLFYVLAHVPPGKPNKFFIISQATANELIRDHPTASDIKWDAGLDYHLEKWDVLPP
jgi:hypothetical protein